jgi:vancomycin resistance protein YoaR
MTSSSSTTMGDGAVAHSTKPTRLSAALFRIRVTGHRFIRGATDLFAGLRRCDQVNDSQFSGVVGESRTKLWSDDRTAEAAYQGGKVQNLRCAARQIDCALLLPGQVFSFWKQVGEASERRGYVTGRMLQQGCMIPAVGGGLCQLSNALHDVALQTGCEIVERHAHSKAVPGSAVAAGRDATVAWNYVDLRFRTEQPLLIRARVLKEELVVSFYVRPGTTPAATEAGVPKAANADGSIQIRALETASTCGTCAETSCFRKEHP